MLNRNEFLGGKTIEHFENCAIKNYKVFNEKLPKCSMKNLKCAIEHLLKLSLYGTIIYEGIFIKHLESVQ